MKVFCVVGVIVLQPNEERLCFSDNGNTGRNLQAQCMSPAKCSSQLLSVLVTMLFVPLNLRTQQYMVLTAGISDTILKENSKRLQPDNPALVLKINTQNSQGYFEGTSTTCTVLIWCSDYVIYACYWQGYYLYFIDQIMALTT